MRFGRGDSYSPTCRERLELGDRIAWNHPVVDDARSIGEICRIDVVHGKVVQLVVFTDCWQYVQVAGRMLSNVRKVTEPRSGIPQSHKFRQGDVALGQGDRGEFVISEVLPNGFVLPEPHAEYPQRRGIPEPVEYLRKSGKRRRSSFKRWLQDEHNPYICRVPIPVARDRAAPVKPASFDRPVRTPVRQKAGDGRVKRRPVPAKAAVPKRRPVRTPVRRAVVRTPVR